MLGPPPAARTGCSWDLAGVYAGPAAVSKPTNTLTVGPVLLPSRRGRIATRTGRGTEQEAED